MTKRRGRPTLALIFGFFAGLFIGLTLLLFGIVPLDSMLLTALPIVLMVVTWAIAMWAPIGSSTPPRQDSPGAIPG